MRIFQAVLAGALALVAATVPAQEPTQLGPPTAPSELASARPLSTAPSPVRPLTREDVDGWLDGYMRSALRTGDIAGAVVTVVRNGQLVTAKGYGFADVAHRRPVDPYRTLFRPGSVSKLITWTAVMQQVELGRIDLDRDVNAYLDFRIPPRDGKPITMRQIMTHTAGFEEAAKDIIAFAPARPPAFEPYLKRWTPARIFDPGTTPAYSNWATTLAAYIVQRVSGEDFYDYTERHVFAPLGMKTATFRQPLPTRLAPLMATGYPRASEPAEPFELIGPAPAGSMSASGVDMARFMISHLQQGRGLLRPETARMMHQSPLGHVDPASLLPPLNRMQLGFFETNVNGREVIGHLGDVLNFHTALHLFMNEGVGIYVSFNSLGKDGAAKVVRVSLLEDFADRYFPGADATGLVDAGAAAAHARMMAGRWDGSRRGSSNFYALIGLMGQVEVATGPKGELVVPALVDASGAPRRWVEVAPFLWRERGGHERLAARVVDGRVVRWSADGFAPFMMFDPAPAFRSLAWIRPAFLASVVVLLVTLFGWPIGWYARRRYGSANPLSGTALKTDRAVRIMSGLDLLVLAGWFALLLAIEGNETLLSAGTDPILWLLQVAGGVIFVGAVAIAGWNAWSIWRGLRSWGARIRSLLVLIATILVLYVAWVAGLLSMTVNY